MLHYPTRTIDNTIDYVPKIKKTKAATKGAKQIVEENKTTLSFYQNMIIGAVGTYFVLMMLIFTFTTVSIVSFILKL